MKQLMIYFVLVLVALNLSAQNADKKWAIGAGAGLYGSLPNKGTGFMPEMYLSRYLSPSFDVFVKDEMGWFNSEVEYYDLDLNIASLNLRYKLFNGKILSVDNSFQPYIYSGLGFIKDSQETSANYRGGIGAKFAIKQNTALYFETGIATNTRPNVIGRIKDESIWKATAGIEFSFGKVKDGDLDGVPDRLDECPDTPAGVQVDEKGCPIDTDGDGVADYVDDCPEVAGPASLKGCPDKDGDGIADKDDECPDVAGLAKLKGCPDSDNDGIADKNDECPDTPEGYKVDDKGCPIDTDGDGIVDEEDECPTVAGIPEEKGCPKKEPELVIVPVTTDFGIQSVYFPVDQSYITSYSRKNWMHWLM